MSNRAMPDIESFTRDAAVLSQALPYMQRYEGKTVVVKYGGHAMGDPSAQQNFARDIALLKQSKVNPIVVHGGGPQIKTMLEKMGIESRFEGGLRVTDARTMEIVEMVLAGSINKQIVTAIGAAGGTGIGLSGKDGKLIEARKLRRSVRDPGSNIEKLLDLGFVGEPVRINPEILRTMLNSNLIPVVAPIGVGEQGETYNINADTSAGAIAAAIGASKLLMLTDVAGVLNKDKKLIPTLTAKESLVLMGDGTISGGMIPKVETCLDAVRGGVQAAHILDGRIPHVLLLELFTAHGVGTMIERTP